MGEGKESESVFARDDTHWHFRHRVLAAAAAAAIVLSAGVLHAALPNDADTSGRTSFAGQLLIAAPALQGSPFERTVILIAQHSHEGALGVVINRPLDERPIADLLQTFGFDATGVKDSVRVYLGGPVSPEIGFVVHSADYRLVNTIDIDGKVPAKFLVAFGYAGWGPSQLDDEIARSDWYNVPEDPALVFDDDRAKVWADAMARRKDH